MRQDRLFVTIGTVPSLQRSCVLYDEKSNQSAFRDGGEVAKASRHPDHHLSDRPIGSGFVPVFPSEERHC